MVDKYAALSRAQLHLDFIHANSTTHSFLFGALAELLDNARDAGATRLDVFSVDNEKLQGGFMLCFLDDGCGMSPEEASDIIYFGTSKKRLSSFKFIGQYGNGLKSGSMRIGKDFILFTKKGETMTCVFFSQTFCEREGLNEVVVPIPSWLTRTREYVTNNLIKFSTELSIIYKYSPFKTEAELMQQFDMIYGKCGTLLVIYNLKLLLNGEPELDVKTDREDILVAGALEDVPERCSFRAYTSVLYFDPRMRIFIQAERVQTKHLCHCLYRPRKYLYVTSSFKGTFKNEVKKAEEAVKIAELMLKETQIKLNQLNRTSPAKSNELQNVLQKAMEDVEAKHKTLKEKQKELKKVKTLTLFFGVSTENRSQAGMFIYSNSRLIKMHEKVGPQLKLKSLLGAGVVGIVNIPLEIMEPSHNKQEFLNVQEYNHLLKVMGQYLIQYCKDTGIISKISERHFQRHEIQIVSARDTLNETHVPIERLIDSLDVIVHSVNSYETDVQEDVTFLLFLRGNRNLSLFWNEFGYQNRKNVEKSLDSIWYQRRQIKDIPFIIQCDLCLKWRVLPSSTNYQEKKIHNIWICADNPNSLENSCHRVEQLPSIPLGTMSTVSQSKHEKEKQLREVVLRYQNKLTEQQPQPQFILPNRIATTCQTSAPKENTKTQRIRPSSGDLKHEFLPSFKLSVSHRGWKRNTEEDSDIEFISETKIMKKTVKKVKSQPCRYPRAPPEHIKPAERPQASSWEMKRKQNQNLMQECKALIEVETNNDDPDIILVLDKRDTGISLKQEKNEVAVIDKGKQELCSVAPEIKRNSSLPNVKSVTMEDLNASSGHKARVSVSGNCEVASSLAKSFQNTFIKETVRKLMSNLREILLYFFPEFQLPLEFDYTYVEEPGANSELEHCPEHTNKKLKMCFNQIKNVYMVQYEKRLKRKIKSTISDATRREEVSEIYLEQSEEKRKLTEDKLKNLRVKLTILLQKLQLGDAASDPEQMDSYLEALLKEDNLFFRNALSKVTIESGHKLPLEKK